MPYTYANGENAERMHDSRWIRVRSVKELARQLMVTDYSVIDSRRTAHNKINDFISEMSEVPGAVAGERFPDTFGLTYVTDADSVFGNLLVALASCASYRTTDKTAKDTDAATGGNKKTAEVAIGIDQGAQDNTKRWEELIKQLMNYGNNRINVYNRRKFEDYTAATWT